MRENRERYHQKMYFTTCFSIILLHGDNLYPVSSKLYKEDITGAGSTTAPASAHLHNSHSSNNSYVQLHGAFKSVPENKRKTINILIKTAALVFLLIFGWASLAGLTKRSFFLNSASASALLPELVHTPDLTVP